MDLTVKLLVADVFRREVHWARSLAADLAAEEESRVGVPINIPDGLPAKHTLHQERIFALEEEVAEL